MDFLKRVKNAATIERLRDRARKDTSPRGYVDLCHALVVQGSPERALSVAQEGVRLFPRSLELADQLRLIWSQAARPELQVLERTARETQSVEALWALAEHYLDAEELDLALETAQKLLKHHPDKAEGPILVGRSLWKRFTRDHVATDGMKALEMFRQAVGLSPGSVEALHLLAEACFYIGAVRKATEAAASALAVEPTNHDIATLHGILRHLAHEKASEKDLVRAVEESDFPWKGYRPPQFRENGAEPPAKGPEVARMLHEISTLAGVRILALARDGIELLGRDGNVFQERRTPPEPLMTLTATFRGRIASSTKRLGIGAFQEAEIILEAATVLAYGGMNGVLLVEVEPGTRTSPVASGCRDVMGSLDRVPGGSGHA